MKKATVYTIAKEAGVSVSTVSNILNHRTGNYSDALEAKVREIASRQGYHLKTKRIKMITPVLDNADTESNIFHIKMRDEIQEVCKQKKYHFSEVLIKQSEFEDRIHSLLEKDDCDGILVVGTILTREQISYMSASKVPYVLVDNGVCGQEHNSVSINNESTAFALTEMMIKNHHTNIGFVGTSSQINNYRERENGFRQAMSYYQLEHRRIYDIPVNASGSVDTDALQNRLEKLMITKHPPTAYCAANDYCAYILLTVCEKMGVKMTVTGFDHIQMPAPYDEYITTATIHSDHLGSAAVNRLLDLIEHPRQKPVKILVSTELIERKSIHKNY